jgi:hypothetical protein
MSTTCEKLVKYTVKTIAKKYSIDYDDLKLNTKKIIKIAKDLGFKILIGKDFELAKKVGAYFRLNKNQMETIIQEVVNAASHWKTMAKEIGIPRNEIEFMAKAFIE